jgi:phage-related baseplate assembly protein
MSVLLEDLLQPLTVAEARASVYAIMAQLGAPTTAWKPNAVVRAVLEVVAILLVGLSFVAVAVTKMQFREHAAGDWETIRARGYYGLERMEATYATGQVTLSNTGGGVYPMDAGDVIIQHDSTQRTYTNASAFTLLAGSIGSPTQVTIDVIATEPGSASNATANNAMTIVTTMLGVAVTSNTAIVGRDQETDEELKVREDASIDALSPNGPAGAYLAAARSAVRANGTNVGVTRVAVSGPSMVGQLSVTAATAVGPVPGSVGTPGDDLDYVNRAIQGTDGAGAVPLGIAAVVASAVAKPISVTADVWYYSTDGRTEAEVKAAAEKLVSDWLPTRPIGGDTGGKVYQSAIRGAVLAVSRYAYNATVAAPAGDVAIGPSEVPTAGAIQITAHMVTQ